MKVFIYAVIAIVAAAIVAGFFFIGSPMEQRLIRFDDQRVQSLQMLQSEILGYYQATRHLPKTLSDIVDPTRGISLPPDPETNAEYGYRVKGLEDFELCADFNRSSPNAYVNGPRPVPAAPYGYVDESWTHPAGHYCFDRPFKKEFYPPNPVPPTIK